MRPPGPGVSDPFSSSMVLFPDFFQAHQFLFDINARHPRAEATRVFSVDDASLVACHRLRNLPTLPRLTNMPGSSQSTLITTLINSERLCEGMPDQ